MSTRVAWLAAEWADPIMAETLQLRAELVAARHRLDRQDAALADRDRRLQRVHDQLVGLRVELMALSAETDQLQALAAAALLELLELTEGPGQ